MSSEPTFVIVGAGQAGGWTAKTLRDRGFGGRVIVLGDEPHPPYERPPLSKEALLGTQPVENCYLWAPEALADQQIEVRQGGAVEAIDRRGKTIALAGGETLAYDKLMLATGARVRTVALPGADLPGLHYVRTIRDTLALREDFARGGRLLVIGGGWIGLEVAAAGRASGLDVTLVEAAPRLCARAVSPDISGYLLGLHRDRGVDVRLGATVERLEGAGRVERAMLSGGDALEVGAVVVGIGVLPNVEMAAAAGLETADGIVVDAFGRTADPDIYAAGDVANHPNEILGRRVRLESWENAQNQAIVAAGAMLGGADPYGDVPWFWSDQYDKNVQLIGLPIDWDEEVVRGDMRGDRFVVFYLKEGLVVGGASVDNARDLRFAKRFMQLRKRVDPHQLADPDVKLQKLLKD